MKIHAYEVATINRFCLTVLDKVFVKLRIFLISILFLNNTLSFHYQGEIMQKTEVEKQTETSKCNNCGSKMVFSPETQTLVCEHCGSIAEFESFATYEKEFSELFNFQQWQDETIVFHCNNCNASEVISKNDIAKACSFCGTTNIVKSSEIPGLKPDTVVPYKITKDVACHKYVEWVSKRFFAPKEFKKSATPEDLKGIYTPAFTFDTNTKSNYQGVLIEYYYTTRRIGDRVITERHEKRFPISGSLNMRFDDILIQASTEIPAKTLSKLAPFETNSGKQYSEKYLHGFTATLYTKDGMTCWKEARSQIDAIIRNAILSKYHYNAVAYLNVQTDCKDIKFKYTLLPIYVGHCNWKQKLYNFFINGFNGNVTGKTPVAGWKVALLVFGILAVLAGIIFASIYFKK